MLPIVLETLTRLAIEAVAEERSKGIPSVVLVLINPSPPGSWHPGAQVGVKTFS
jgi:hypothetical protein